MENEPKQHADWPRPAVGPVRLADALGWASAGLGTPMVLMPRRLLAAIGVEPDDRAVRWTVGVGVREFLATVNIVANRQRRIGMWSRVAGDTMDLVLLARAHRHRRADGDRLRGAMGAVAALFALDLVTAIQLARAEGAHVQDGAGSSGEGAEHDTGGGPLRVRTAITIRRPQDEVRRAFAEHDWEAFDAAALEGAGEVRFAPAPGGRGTEIHLDHEPEAGGVAARAAKALGQAPDQRITDELRRFKAVLETGTFPRSEKSPEGPSARRQLFHKRQPAQPPVGGRA